MKTRLLSIVTLVTLLFSFSFTVLASPTTTTDTSNEIIILHTNDTHCAIEDGLGFAGVAAYKADMEEIYGEDFVTLVDAGDAVQGGPLGTLTEGEALIEIMNSVGYDYMAPGNHEYDYGMDQFFNLMSMSNATILSCNFVDLTTNTTPFDGYAIEDYDGVQVAYVGITTPDTISSSDPTSFQDDDGNYIYSFSQEATGELLYSAVQDAVDSAVSDGADYVVAIAHLGTDESVWSSLEVIENTTGIDVFIDGHSHSTVDGEEILNEDGEAVILSQTGSKFENLGKITINTDDDTITTELITADEDDENAYTDKDETVLAKIAEINAEFELILNEVVAYTSVDLLATDPETEERIVRSQETNLGDLVADAYRTLLDTDIAITNGGGVRASIDAGDITYEDIINVHPFGNEILSVELTGQAILDALEFGASMTPESNSSFLQVSGLTYTIDTTIESSVQIDGDGNFVSVDGEYRVSQVMVGDEALDLEKTYTVASHNYYLLSYGDGFTMFKDSTVVQDTGIVDNEVLISYIVDYLDGVVGDEYANPYGDGRITILTEASEALDEEDKTEDETTDEVITDDNTTDDNTTDDNATDDNATDDDTNEDSTDDDTAPETGDYPSSLIWFMLISLSLGLGIVSLRQISKL